MCIRIYSLVFLLALYGCNQNDSDQNSMLFKISKAKLENSTLEIKSKIVFSTAVKQAINHGIPITLKLEFESYQAKQFFTRSTALLHIKYKSMSKTYILQDTEKNKQYSFPNLNSLLIQLTDYYPWELATSGKFQNNPKIHGRARIKLLLEALPASLRLFAYLSKDWHAKSPWFVWQLNDQQR